MLHRLSHRQLEAFRAVIETGKVTSAADVLNTTQPSISRMISDLERVTGFKLFERRGRQIFPTSEALALYEEVERSFVGLSEISRVIEDIRDYRRGSLVIAGMPAMALKLLPDAITDFALSAPEIVVSLRARSSQSVLRHVSSQRFDLGFAALENDHPAVLRKPLCISPMQAVVPVDHPLARKAFLEPGDFDGQPFVANGPEITTRSDIDVYLAASKSQPKIVAVTQLSASICEMVGNGLGLSIVEPITAVNFAARGTVVALPLKPELSFRYDLLLPALREPSLVATRFLELVETRIQSLLGASM